MYKVCFNLIQKSSLNLGHPLHSTPPVLRPVKVLRRRRGGDDSGSSGPGREKGRREGRDWAL